MRWLDGRHDNTISTRHTRPMRKQIGTMFLLPTKRLLILIMLAFNESRLQSETQRFLRWRNNSLNSSCISRRSFWIVPNILILKIILFLRWLTTYAGMIVLNSWTSFLFSKLRRRRSGKEYKNREVLANNIDLECKQLKWRISDRTFILSKTQLTMETARWDKSDLNYLSRRFLTTYYLCLGNLCDSSTSTVDTGWENNSDQSGMYKDRCHGKFSSGLWYSWRTGDPFLAVDHGRLFRLYNPIAEK